MSNVMKPYIPHFCRIVVTLWFILDLVFLFLHKKIVSFLFNSIKMQELFFLSHRLYFSFLNIVRYLIVLFI